MFAPIIQDETQVTFCKMLDKSDASINPENATKIWSHWRAFIAFPFTILIDSTFGQIKILKCHINPDFTSFLDLAINEQNVKNNDKIDDKFSDKSDAKSKTTMQSFVQEKPNQNSEEKLVKITKITRKNSWIQVKIGKQNLTFLLCDDQSLLQIQKIGLVDGKQIDFAGYIFD